MISLTLTFANPVLKGAGFFYSFALVRFGFGGLGAAIEISSRNLAIRWAGATSVTDSQPSGMSPAMLAKAFCASATFWNSSQTIVTASPTDAYKNTDTLLLVKFKHVVPAEILSQITCNK